MGRNGKRRQLTSLTVGLAICGLLGGCAEQPSATDTTASDKSTVANEPVKTAPGPPAEPQPVTQSNSTVAEPTQEADRQAMAAYQLFLDGKDCSGALDKAKESRLLPVIKSLITARQSEDGLSPGTASAEKTWKSTIDPLYEKTLASAFEIGPEAVKLVKTAAANSARSFGTDDRATEWDSVPESAAG